MKTVTRKTLVSSVIVVAMLWLLGSTTALAKMEWSITPVHEFTVPPGNIIKGGDMSEGIPDIVKFGYAWVDNHELDTVTFLTGNGSMLVWHYMNEQGRILFDVPVDGDKKYKFGFVVKTESLMPGTGRPARYGMRWGIYLKDGQGAFLNVNSLKTKPVDYLNGLVPSGSVIRTPSEIDLGDGLKPLAGTHDWFHLELVLDLPALAADLTAGSGRITAVRLEQLLSESPIKIWVDCIYALPLEE